MSTPNNRAAALFDPEPAGAAQGVPTHMPVITSADVNETAADVILECIARDGSEYVFGVPGSAITPMYRSLQRKHAGIHHILAKHEAGAGFMAYGYARVRRSIGVTMTTTGPGGINALTPAACGLADGVPMMFLTGQNATSYYGRSALQDSTALGADMVGMFRHVTKFSSSVPSASVARDVVERAVALSHMGRPGPVHLGLPTDIQKGRTPPRTRPAPDLHPDSRPVDIAAAIEGARVLSRASQPAILVGYGAVLSGAWDALLQLATRLRIPVATTPKAKGVFPESHPLSLGVFGFGGHPRAESYLLGGGCDVLMVLGSTLGELGTHHWDQRLMPRRALVRVDIDPAEVNKNFRADVPIIGDVRAALEVMSQAVERERLARFDAPADPLADLRRTVPRVIEPPSSVSGRFKPQRLVQEMRAAMGDDALLFVDIGNCIIWATHYFECNTPLTYHLSLGFASMGTAVAGAIGAKLAAPERPVVALVGDGAFGMNGLEVHTAVDHDIPVVWVVLNNGGHGMVYHGERMVFGEDLGASRFRVPMDIAGLARAMGADAVTVDSPEEFRVAFGRALQARAPVVIDAHIDPEEVPQPLRHRARAVASNVKQ